MISRIFPLPSGLQAATFFLSALSAPAVTPEQIEELVPRSPVPATGDFEAITASGDTFVALTNLSEVIVSRDRGARWAAAPAIAGASRTNPPQAIANDGTRYVAVALNESHVSTDLVTWTSSSRIGGGGYDVAFGGGRFVTVGSVGGILFSPDGETWTAAATVPTTEDLETIAFGNGVFVAGGDAGQLLRSTDGDTWTLVFDGIPGAADARENTFDTISFANGLFFAGAYPTTLFSSPDGTAWSLLPLEGMPSGGPDDVVYDGTRYIVSTSFGNSGISTDGFATVTEPERENDVQHLAESGGTVVSIGRRAGLGVLEGNTWREITQRVGERFNSVVFADGKFVIADSNTGRIFTSRLGITWTFVFEASSNFRSQVAYGGGRYVVLIGNDRVATSTNGTVWTETEHDADGVVDGLTYLSDRFILYGRGGNLYSGQDGVSWTKSTIADDFWPEDLAFGNGIYAIAGNSNSIFTSSDFVTWTPRPTGAAEGKEFTGVEYIADRFIALERFSPPAVSSDGTNWTLDTEASKFHLNSSFTDPDLGLYTLGTLGTIRYFPDPADLGSFEQINYPSTLQASGFAEGNGVVVLVGSDGLLLSTPGEAAGYEGWAGLRFPLGAPRTGPGEDFDFDGQLNLIEYARGTDPTAATPGFLAAPEQTAFGPEITWTQRSSAPGVAATAEYSSDLTTWTNSAQPSSGIIIDTEPLDGDMERVTARVTGSAGNAPPLYLRVRWALTP